MRVKAPMITCWATLDMPGKAPQFTASAGCGAVAAAAGPGWPRGKLLAAGGTGLTLVPRPRPRRVRSSGIKGIPCIGDDLVK